MDNSTFSQITRGLYVVGARDGEKFCGCVVSDILQDCETLSLIVNINRNSHTGECLKTGYDLKNIQSEFSISVLSFDIDPMIIANFGFKSSENIDKWQNINYTLFNGLPIIPNCCAYFHCKVDTRYSLFSEFPNHTMFFSKIMDSKIGRGEPMTYKYYLENIKQKI